MRLRDSYDIPPEVSQGPHSPAFGKFLWNWFGDTGPLTHGELDLSFLNDLAPEEIAVARSLIRRNLTLGQTHIIQGAWALHDLDAVPILQRMLDAESDESRRLVIAGALWRIAKDSVFITCLDRAKEGRLLVHLHLLQVLWLDDERAVDFLIDLLDHKDGRVGGGALSLLNQLELGHFIPRPVRELTHQPADYYKRRHDPAFRQAMTAAVRKWNREMKTGW